MRFVVPVKIYKRLEMVPSGNGPISCQKDIVLLVRHWSVRITICPFPDLCYKYSRALEVTFLQPCILLQLSSTVVMSYIVNIHL